MPEETIRVIEDPPLDGPANMARDEVLLDRVGRGESPATLRFYQWAPPTISLGYFQRYADFRELEEPAGRMPVVRRLTGGGAILHDRELTYSICLPLAHAFLEEGPVALYEIAHDALIDAMAAGNVSAGRCGITDDSGAAKGPFFCFQRRHCLDVLIGSDKVAGSAQRRTRQAVLQHGSIVLERRYGQQPAAALADLAPMTPSLLAERMVCALARRTGGRFESGQWSAGELAEADALTAKYAGGEWTERTC